MEKGFVPWGAGDCSGMAQTFIQIAGSFIYTVERSFVLRHLSHTGGKRFHYLNVSVLSTFSDPGIKIWNLSHFSIQSNFVDPWTTVSLTRMSRDYSTVGASLLADPLLVRWQKLLRRVHVSLPSKEAKRKVCSMDISSIFFISIIDPRTANLQGG